MWSQARRPFPLPGVPRVRSGADGRAFRTIVAYWHLHCDILIARHRLLRTSSIRHGQQMLRALPAEKNPQYRCGD